VVAFFRRKAAAERQVGAELRALLQDALDSDEEPLEALEEPGTSLRRALLELRASVEAACHQQLLLATVLEEQVAEPLAALQDASAMYIRTLQGEMRNVDDEYAAAAAAHKEVGTGPMTSLSWVHSAHLVEWSRRPGGRRGRRMSYGRRASASGLHCMCGSGALLLWPWTYLADTACGVA
jgi:hypothetical protein